MTQRFANAARGVLASAIGAGDTSIEITEGGELFPAISGDEWFKAVLQDADGIEIVRVNARSGNVFTVVRGQEGTTARDFAMGSVFGQRVTAGDMEDRATLNGTETLTSKTLVDPVLTLGADQGTAGQVPVSQGAGLPPVWGSVESFSVGDILVSNRALSAPQWLPADGSLYLQSAYPELFAQVGLLSFLGNWTTRTSGFGSTVIRGVTFGNGLFVAVGGNGTLTTSPDGITWTARTSGFGTNSILGVTFDNGLFVAVGGNGTLTTSPDGITWTTRTSGFGATFIFGVTFGNGLFVAVGNNGVLTTSPDGITWTTRTSGFGTNSIFGVTFGNGLFVAVGNNGVLTTSPDGITWTARTSGFGTTIIRGVTFGNGLFVAVGDSGTLTTSGINYNPSTQFATPTVNLASGTTGVTSYVRATP